MGGSGRLGCRQSNFAAKLDVVATGSNENVDISRIGVPPLCGGVIVGKSPVIERHSDVAILPGAETSFSEALKLLNGPRHLAVGVSYVHLRDFRAFAFSGVG